ncbi:hypothetical protein K402DRAFT_416988 [Aulographum hederae CBS 113979]|uniref:Uncharacterized protein n=1 Tax=Aulographum hederae CBS 113979 TaxID=1176131 RepID=A0A6G1HEX8_9PEZI|nr:hypothetical protein K402DRAFT_416988 [Aulographum hederae CBS 113979]
MDDFPDNPKGREHTLQALLNRWETTHQQHSGGVGPIRYGKSFLGIWLWNRNILEIPVSLRSSLWLIAPPPCAETYAKQLQNAIRIHVRDCVPSEDTGHVLSLQHDQILCEIARLATLEGGADPATELLIWIKTWVLHNRSDGLHYQWSVGFSTTIPYFLYSWHVATNRLLMSISLRAWKDHKYVWDVSRYLDDLQRALAEFHHGENDDCQNYFGQELGVLLRIQRHYTRIPVIKGNAYLVAGRHLPAELLENVIDQTIEAEGLAEKSAGARCILETEDGQYFGPIYETIPLGDDLDENVELLERGYCTFVDPVPESLRCPAVHDKSLSGVYHFS